MNEQPMQTEQFSEEFIGGKVDPLYDTTVDFDMAAVERALGEHVDETGQEQLTKMVRRLFEWVVAVDLEAANSQAIVGRRFIAAVWVTNPALFETSPSAAQLARVLGINRKADFWELTGEAARELGITNRGQKNGWNRKN